MVAIEYTRLSATYNSYAHPAKAGCHALAVMVLVSASLGAQAAWPGAGFRTCY